VRRIQGPKRDFAGVWQMQDLGKIAENRHIFLDLAP
jgi:hypothetical protein